ncbi:MAG TPA: hypothetical protein VFR11_04125 [Micromonosporaceae bacterium]|nr:hypothetical protein [Micromonosporaceae bacterium]
MSLSLAEQLVWLARGPSSRLRTEGTLAWAGTAAAAFAGLRLAGRISHDPSTGGVVVDDDTPLGDRMADRVLGTPVGPGRSADDPRVASRGHPRIGRFDNW